MAKEKTIRKKAKDKLTADGWIVSMPNRQRYGATTTTLPDGQEFDNDEQYKKHDDLFSIFDGMAWKQDKLRLIQWTAHGAVSKRRNKINNFIDSHNINVPDGASIEVWGYKDRKGFTRQENITN